MYRKQCALIAPCVLLLWTVVARVDAESAASPGRPYYLMDQRVVESSQGVRLDVHAPRKAGVVLKQEMPWEKFYMHPTTLLEHNGEYLLYYFVYPIEGRFHRHGMCLATSKDGLHWKRPELGQVEYQGSKKNNLIDIPYAPPCKNADPNALTEHRFLLLGPDQKTKYGDPNYVLDSLALYCSPDGRVWKQITTTLSPFTCDANNQIVYNQITNKYIVYLRAFSPAHGGRFVVRYEPPDLFKPWPIKPSASNKYQMYNTPDGPMRHVYIQDEMPVAIEWVPSKQVYNPGVMPIPGMYLALPDIFRVFPGPVHPDKSRFPDSELYGWSNDGFCTPRLYVSEDGKAFRPIGEKPYIDLGTGNDLDAKQVRMVTGMIEHGEEIWQYYGGQRTTHTLQRGRRPRKGSAVMRVVQRKDGFAALIAGNQEATVLTQPVICSGKQIQVNFNAGSWGDVRVELLDEEGRPIANYSASDSALMVGNVVYDPVQWSARRDLTPLEGKTICIRFHLSDAQLFSFRFQ